MYIYIIYIYITQVVSSQTRHAPAEGPPLQTCHAPFPWPSSMSNSRRWFTFVRGLGGLALAGRDRRGLSLLSPVWDRGMDDRCSF